VPQRHEYVTRNAMRVRMQGQSTIEEHAVKEDDTDIDEILRKLAASRAKKKKKNLVLMYNIIIPIIYNKKKFTYACQY
jgi:riboflavin synthase